MCEKQEGAGLVKAGEGERRRDRKTVGDKHKDRKRMGRLHRASEALVRTWLLLWVKWGATAQFWVEK